MNGGINVYTNAHFAVQDEMGDDVGAIEAIELTQRT